MTKQTYCRVMSVVILMASLVGHAAVASAVQPPSELRVDRELHVPYDDLNILLEGGVERVLMTRQEYESLLAHSKRQPVDAAPLRAALIAGDYEIAIDDARAVIRATLTIDGLEDGLHPVPLDFSGVGIRGAVIDGVDAPIAIGDDGRPVVFVRDVGRRELRVEAVAPLRPVDAHRALQIKIPTPASTRISVTAVGDVEIRSGLTVIRRDYDAAAGVTRFELLPERGPVSLVVSMNHRFEQSQATLLSRSVTVATVQGTTEQIETTASISVLHRAVERLRFSVPQGFEVTRVTCPHLASWTVAETGASKVLEIELSEPVADTEVVRITANRQVPTPAEWSLQRIAPLGVVSDVSIVGLVLDQRLSVRAAMPEGLIPLDTAVIDAVVAGDRPAGVPVVSATRPVLAFYAPQGGFGLKAEIEKAPAELRVAATLSMTLDRSTQRVRGGLTLAPLGEACYGFDLLVPGGWRVTALTDSDRAPLRFDPVREGAGGQTHERLRVRLPAGILPGEQRIVYFEAEALPQGWLGGWRDIQVAMPNFAVAGASAQTGVVMVIGDDDLAVVPDRLVGLAALDENEKAEYGLGGGDATAYRYDEPGYEGVFRVSRYQPRLSAETVSSFRLNPDTLDAHYELVFRIDRARTDRLALLLPQSTPIAISITSVSGATVKEFTDHPAEGGMRHWSVTLAEPVRGSVRLAVDFQQRITGNGESELTLPVVVADAVEYQSGLVSIEGSDELDIEVTAHPRRVDVGELVDATYQPGPRLLGVYQFVGHPDAVTVVHERSGGYGLPPAVIQHAGLRTAVSANGLAQTVAAYRLRAQALFLEVRLPDQSRLWTATLDGEPIKPQRESGRILLDLPASPYSVDRELVIVYETPVDAIGAYGDLALGAPGMVFHSGMPADSGDYSPAAAVPVTEFEWILYPPRGYRMVASHGTVTTEAAAWPRGSGAVLFGGSAGTASRASPSDHSHLERALSKLSVPDGRSGFKVTAKKSSKKSADELLGVRGLDIALDAEGDPIRFHSLGASPRLQVTLVDHRRIDAFARAVGLLVFTIGVALVTRTPITKVRYLLVTSFVATVPLLFSRPDLAQVGYAGLMGVMCLVPFYACAGVIAFIARRVRTPRLPVGAVATGAVVVAVLIGLGVNPASAADEPEDVGPPVVVPDDAVVVPYDPADASSDPADDRLLVPYERFVELWNLAYPNEAIEAVDLVVPYALAGTAFTATLTSQSHLVFEGGFEVEVFTDGVVSVPLALVGGVFASATLDGQPAPVRTVGLDLVADRQARFLPQDAGNELSVLQVRGRGRHRVGLQVHVPLTRQGGWRIAACRLPSGVAASLALTVPDAGTEVRLTDVTDQSLVETKETGQRIETAVGRDGRVAIHWRAKVDLGGVDRGLKADCHAIVEVEHGRVRSTWSFDLAFPRGEREGFEVRIPDGYLVESVEGANIRGWRADDSQESTVRISLLRPAKDRESFVVRVRREQGDGYGEATEIDAPSLVVTGAAVQSGTLVIRRSPGLTVRTLAATGASRTDMPQAASHHAAARESGGVMRTTPHEAYRFASSGLGIRMAVSPTPIRRSARVQTLVRLGSNEHTVESRVVMNVKQGVVHAATVDVPRGFTTDAVSAPMPFEWAIVPSRDGQRITVSLGVGQRDEFAIVIKGALSSDGAATKLPLPRIVVGDVEDQRGDIVIQTDPGTDAAMEGLAGCRSIALARADSWLSPAQRPLARLALTYEKAAYRGTIVLSQRGAEVSCSTVTSIRVTDRAIEETILFDFQVSNAGLREVAFLLPDRLADARVSVPLLRRKTVMSAEGNAGWVRVRLQLQDSVIGPLRVLVEHDRPLSHEVQDGPIPIVETGLVEQRLMSLENTGSDEAVIESYAGMQPLTDRLAKHHGLSRLLALGSAQSYEATGPDVEPKFTFRMKSRETVRTVDARIGLAQTVFVLDAAGAYRAAQSYRIDNGTEQYLEIELPGGAELWAATVAGNPVKPVRPPGAASAGLIRIPLIKTAPGDLDYEVTVTYAGELGRLHRLASMDFPMIRATNIGVELSQARLFLPDTHRWFGFEGSMRRVTRAGDLEAGYLSYTSKQVERLTHTLKDSNPYAQARASHNIADLKGQIGAYQDQLGRVGGNEELRRQQASNAAILEQAEREAKRVEADEAAPVYAGGRARLNEVWATQKNVRSGKAIEQLDANFRAVPSPQPKTEGTDPGVGGEFSYQWLADHGLAKQADNAPGLDQVGQPRPTGRPTARPTGPLEIGDQRINQQPQAPRWDRLTESESVQLHRPDDEEQSQASRESGNKPALTKRDLYRRKLNRARGDRTDDELVEAFSSDGLLRDTVTLHDRDMLSSVVRGGGGEWEAGGFANGIASLDVQIVTAGTEYRFTTPRGQVQLSGRAVAESSVTIVRRLLAYLTILVVVGWLMWMYQRQAARAG